ncbi:MAG TPA: 50S ribosomal protein L4 [Firmicutes bacterium]|nr:50S ribosomal protein L4 [Bacillota bacterium]
MQVKLFDTSAKEIGALELNDSVFGCEYNEALIHQVVVAQLANARQGTKSTLTRTEVRGGGRKPWRQKGTGHARQGSIRAPQWVKGGVVFAPKPRDFSKKANKRAKYQAFKSAISYKAQHNEIIVVDKIELPEIKTKHVQKILSNFKLDKKVLLVLPEYNEAVLRAGRNIENLAISTVELVSLYEVVSNATIMMTADAVKNMEEAFAE